MGRYSDEQKAESIRRARALLERLDAEDAARAEAEVGGDNSHHFSPEPGLTQSCGVLPLLSTEPLDRWRAKAEEREAQRKREKKMTDAQQAKQWEQWCDARITRALAEHTRGSEQAIGEALGTIREQLREEIKNAVGELRAELTVAKAHERGGPVIDLPALSFQRRGNAA
jgi:hypothetical protein